MVNNNNIYRCRGCKRLLLSEELQYHVCKEMEDYKFEADGSILNVFDGERWYPLKWLKKSPTKDEQPDRNTSETEHYQK